MWVAHTHTHTHTRARAFQLHRHPLAHHPRSPTQCNNQHPCSFVCEPSMKNTRTWYFLKGKERKKSEPGTQQEQKTNDCKIICLNPRAELIAHSEQWQPAIVLGPRHGPDPDSLRNRWGMIYKFESLRQQLRKENRMTEYLCCVCSERKDHDFPADFCPVRPWPRVLQEKKYFGG